MKKIPDIINNAIVLTLILGTFSVGIPLLFFLVPYEGSYISNLISVILLSLLFGVPLVFIWKKAIRVLKQQKTEEKKLESQRESTKYRKRLAEYFKDPLAGEIQWDALKENGFKMRTHFLKRINDQRMAYISGGFKFNGFVWFFMAMGLLLLSLVVIAHLDDARMKDKTLFLSVFYSMGGAFFLSGFLVKIIVGRPRVFCKQLGAYWVGSQPGRMLKPSKGVPLNDIHAIQIIGRISQRSANPKFPILFSMIGPPVAVAWGAMKAMERIYEMCLVLQSGQRVSVILLKKARPLRDDAKRLGKFLNVPVWDFSMPEKVFPGVKNK